MLASNESLDARVSPKCRDAAAARPRKQYSTARESPRPARERRRERRDAGRNRRVAGRARVIISRPTAATPRPQHDSSTPERKSSRGRQLALCRAREPSCPRSRRARAIVSSRDAAPPWPRPASSAPRAIIQRELATAAIVRGGAGTESGVARAGACGRWRGGNARAERMATRERESGRAATPRPGTWIVSGVDRGTAAARAGRGSSVGWIAAPPRPETWIVSGMDCGTAAARDVDIPRGGSRDRTRCGRRVDAVTAGSCRRQGGVASTPPRRVRDDAAAAGSRRRCGSRGPSENDAPHRFNAPRVRPSPRAAEFARLRADP